jgi:hypothetical protein
MYLLRDASDMTCVTFCELLKVSWLSVENLRVSVLQ